MFRKPGGSERVPATRRMKLERSIRAFYEAVKIRNQGVKYGKDQTGADG